MSTTIKKVIGEFKGALGINSGSYNRNILPYNWEKVPAVARMQKERECGGEPERYANLYDYAIKRWGSRLPKRQLTALVIGCSRNPQLPGLLLDTERVRSVLVVDDDAVILENLLEKGRSGIECWQMELNTDPLPRGPFDVIACCDSLNHLRDPKHIGREIERVIDRSGLFIAREYVGPERMQFTPEQISLVNSVLQLIPEKYRQCMQSGQLITEQQAPELADLLRVDPSRAACSDELEKVINLHLRIMQEIPLGGTILSPLLASISQSFEPDNAECRRIIETLLKVEMQLIEGGLINCDYKAFIARPY